MNHMRTRTKEIKIRLTEKELQDLNTKAKWAGMNREAYLRRVLSDAVVYEWPPHDVFQLSIDLRRVGTDLGHIRNSLWDNKEVDFKMLTETYKKAWAASDAIMKEFLYPEEKFNKKKGKQL